MSKVSKRRHCPAVRREITAAECGENRGSRYACPADCVHSPLASCNYDQLLELESAVDKKSLGLLAEETRRNPALEKASNRALSSESGHALHAFCSWQLFFQRDAAGLTLAEKWERSGLSDLKNDGRVVLRGKMKTRVALLEIHRVLDQQRIEAVDLLSPEAKPILLYDTSLASLAGRFVICLGWIYPLPHYWRLHGTVIVLPDIAQFEPDYIVREIVRHSGGSIIEEELRLWLAEHFVRFDDVLHATAQRRQQQMISGVDAHFGKAIYELRAPFGRCRDALDEVAEVESERLSSENKDEGFVESRVWLDKAGESMMPEGAQTVLGHILLGQTFWRLEAMGKERLEKLRGKFESAMGDKVKFSGERRDDLAVDLLSKKTSPEDGAVPPSLLEQPSQVSLTSSRMPSSSAGMSPQEVEKEIMAAQERAFLDDHIPALEGCTPREAAKDPRLRPKLIRLVKQRVRARDEYNLEHGETGDINWLLRELSLDEIIFDPPPLRPRPVRNDREEDEEVDPFHVPQVVRSGRALTTEEIDERLEEFGDLCARDKGIKNMIAMSRPLLDQARDLINELVTDDDFASVLVFLMQARFVLVPPGDGEPVLADEALVDSFEREAQGLLKTTARKSPPTVKELTAFFENSSQSELCRTLVGTFFRQVEEMPPSERPDREAQLLLGVLLKTIIGELDRALRR